MKLTIDNKLHANLPTLTATEYAGLEHKILTEGFRDPIVTWAGTDIILDGRNRYNICQTHNLTFTTSSLAIANDDAARIWIIDNQANKRNISEFIKFELLEEKQELLKAQGKSNIIQRNKNSTLSTVDKVEITPVDTRKEIAKEIGKSTGHVAKLNYVKEHADESTKEKLRQNEVTANEVYQDIKSAEKKEKRDKQISEIRKSIATENLTVTDKFDVLNIDPPWKYSLASGCDETKYDPNGNRGVVPYPTMTLEQIQAIELPLKDDAVVFLWTVHAFLPHAYELLKQWGLDYKATMVWDKEKMGMGRTIRFQCEFCLLATKGNPTIQGQATRDIIREARREHSRKPEAFYKMVEEITIGSKLDYFSREQRKGWKSLGIEANKFDN